MNKKYKNHLAIMVIIILSVLVFAYHGGKIVYNFVITPIINAVFYSEKSQYHDLYKLNDSETAQLIHTINLGMQIVSTKLLGKENFFDDIMPFSSYNMPIVDYAAPNLEEVSSVRYTKGFIRLEVSYDDYVWRLLKDKEWNSAQISFSDPNKWFNNDANFLKTVEVLWDKKEFEQDLHLIFEKKEDIKNRHLGSGIMYVAKHYYFRWALNKKIHVEFVTAALKQNSVKSNSDYPKFFSYINIYKEDENKKRLLADEQKKKDASNNEKKQNILKQLGIQE